MFKSICYYDRYILEGQTRAGGNTITHVYLTTAVTYWKAIKQNNRSLINLLMVHPLDTQEGGLLLLIKIIEYVQKHILLRQLYIRRPHYGRNNYDRYILEATLGPTAIQ